MTGLGPIQKRVRRAFLAHPNREFFTTELVRWAYPRLAGKLVTTSNSGGSLLRLVTWPNSCGESFLVAAFGERRGGGSSGFPIRIGFVGV